MKTRFNNLFLLLFVLANLLAHAKEAPKYAKQKSVKKAYIVNPDADINIDNAYGNVYVTTWNENKIELDVLIKVSGDNEEWVNKRLNGIDIYLEAFKHAVTAVTQIDRDLSGKKGNNNSIEINYTVKIPKNGGVYIKNKYGDIITADLFANTDIECKYGKITLGKLNGNDNRIDIKYCNKSSVDHLKTAMIDADYSGLAINTFGNIVLNADYTDVNFREGDNLKYDCSYGKLNYGKLDNIEGTGDYLTIDIGALSKNLKINTKYSRLTVDNVSATAGNISIDSEYTTVGIGYNTAYAFDFDIKLKYANLKHGSDLEMNSKQENGQTKSYEGFYKKSGVNKINIISDYGNVNLTKNQ